MTTYGLTADGFVPMPLTAIRADLEAAIRIAFGASMKLGDRSAFGQFLGILAERLALLWELLEAINSSQDPDKAVGALLEALCALTGTFRPLASYSSVILALTGVPATAVASGSRASTSSTSKEFSTTTTGTITLLSTWAPTTSYAFNARVTLGGNAYQCTLAGVSAGSGGPTGTGTAIVDGAAHWDYLGLGTGACDVAAQAVDTGPVTAFARDIATITSPVSGWQGVVNVLDANAGRDLATDEELRVLREQELGGFGEATVDAIRAVLLRITDGVQRVLAVTVFENKTDATDGDGMPPHSVEALVRTEWSPGDDRDQLIYNALLQHVAGGIVTTGSTTGSAIDSQDTVQVIKFSRPTEVEIAVILNVEKDGDYPDDGDDLVAKAVVAWGNAQSTGKNAVASRIAAAAFDVDGVLDVTALIAISPSVPSLGTTIPISLRQLAVYDTSRITVVTTDGVA